MKQNSTGGGWTIRKASESARGPVTRETVKRLSNDKSLHGVAKVAKKYAK
jgi:hypothetical protein